MPKYAIFLISFVLILYGCQNNTGERTAGVQLLKGKKRFKTEFEKLQSPLGIVPIGSEISSSDILEKDPASWNEFFLIDQFTSIVVLSAAPRYFLKIDSLDFYHPLRREYLQIKDNRTAANGTKQQSSNPFLKEVGDYEIEVYFTPEELNYNNSCRISQASKHKPPPDIWRLMAAAKKSLLFTPEFEDEQILKDFQAAKEQSKERVIYTLENNEPSALNSDIIKNVDFLFNFSFIWGKNLEVTEDLLDKVVLEFEDIYELTSDFMAFFSLPLGNPRGNVPAYKLGCTPNSEGLLDTKDGIVVLVRGDLQWLEKFLTQEGFQFETK